MTQDSVKIIYIVYKFTVDGSSIALLNLLDCLKDRNISPLIIMAKEGNLCDELKKRDIPYYVVPFHLSRYYRFGHPILNFLMFFPLQGYLLVQNFFAIRKTISIAKKIKAKIIHTNIGPLYVGYNTARLLSIPHVWHIREYQNTIYSMKAFPSLKIFKMRLHKSHAIAISRGIYDYFSMSEKAKVIYDGVLGATDIKFIPAKSKYFLFVGNVQENKGIEMLIDSFIEFSKQYPDFNLNVAGWGKESYILKLKDRIESKGEIKKISFLGPRKDILNLLANATSCVVSSYTEGFGFVTAESMFSGCLVIGYNVSGTKEQFDNGFNMHNEEIAIRYSNQQELTEAMLNVAGNGIEKYFPMIMRAQKTVCELYSIQRHSSEVYNFYREILKS